MDNATRKYCFVQWLSLVDSHAFHTAIAAHSADRYVKELDTATVLQLFLYAQLMNASGLRELEIAFRNNAALQQELNLKSISSAQLKSPPSETQLTRGCPAPFT